MDEIVWAFCSMLFVMLIVYFLPLGLTKKGKVILVGISFVLALGGMAASTSFSLSLSLLILVILILFVSYLMDQRLGMWLYPQEDFLEEQESDESIRNLEIETAASLEKVYQRKNETSIEPIHFLKDPIEKDTNVQANRDEEFPSFEEGDEDISFLLNRSFSMEKESSKKMDEQQHNEVDYLSEIEELLQSTEESTTPPSSDPVRDHDNEIPVISFEDNPVKKSNISAKKIEDSDVIPVLPFHEQKGEQS